MCIHAQLELSISRNATTLSLLKKASQLCSIRNMNFSHFSHSTVVTLLVLNIRVDNFDI